ncbi:CamS family sex pheromone protein [Alteribacillus sp. HJP-4]|uniref:CamS family sex pheromone protein n=1 Tax=Alteribacillus sp. HJP-4 TaxID=2775394 RepID=UPI0035CD39B3
MIKKAWFASMSVLILLGGCLPGMQPDDEGVDIEQDEANEDETDVEVSPEVPSLKNNYRSILEDDEYIHGSTRGYSPDIVYNRLDLERMEIGLQEIASDDFPTEDYFFREGQFITREEIDNWLRREADPNEEGEGGNPNGLNPPLGEGDSFEERERSAPRPLSTILEHNYVVENDNGNLQLGGIVIGLSMNSIYYFREQEEDGAYGPWLEQQIDEETSLEEGKALAQEILQRLRDEEREDGELSQVPLTFALFREAPRDSPVPGEFIATGHADPGEDVGNWETLNESHYLFPSDAANEDQRADNEAFNQFREDVNQFFENYIGVVGRGYYQNDELRSLKIDVPIRYYSETEVIALTQHITDRLEQRFPSELEIEVKIKSTNGQEALIVKEANEDPFVHVY